MCNNSIGYPVGSIHEGEGENGIISKRENALRHISPRETSGEENFSVEVCRTTRYRLLHDRLVRFNENHSGDF